jgi:hypothetical protein
MDVGDQLIGIRGNDREGPNYAREAEQAPVFHFNGVGLLCPFVP